MQATNHGNGEGLPKRQWKRNLYERQPYKDNYTDPVKFLDQLNVVRYTVSQESSYSSTFLYASVVVQQFTAVTLFLTVYKYSLKNPSSNFMAILDSALLVGGYIVHGYLEQSVLSFSNNVKKILLFLICLRISAPILRALTLPFSSDTIHALAISLSSIHLVFHDYPFINGDKDQHGGTVSLNAAIFAAIILASRLHTVEEVLEFILLAVIVFSFFPRTARLMKTKSRVLHLLSTTALWVTASGALWLLDKTLCAIYELVILFLWFVGPLCYLHMLVFKRAMKGPWDIASVE